MELTISSDDTDARIVLLVSRFNGFVVESLVQRRAGYPERHGAR